jgi:hypothetical protein
MVEIPRRRDRTGLGAAKMQELESQPRPSLKDLLSSDEARTDYLAPERRPLKLRPLVAFD